MTEAAAKEVEAEKLLNLEKLIHERLIDQEKAEVVIHGFIKWDGCCQWWADCAHTDTKGEMEELCKVLREIYFKADEIMCLR
jgi:hypothetical protein